MLLIAFFAGVLNIQSDLELNDKKFPTPKQQPKSVIGKKDEVQLVQNEISVDDISLDDMSFEQEPGDTMKNTEVHQSNQENGWLLNQKKILLTLMKPVGRLSALRKEMATDSGER